MPSGSQNRRALDAIARKSVPAVLLLHSSAIHIGIGPSPNDSDLFDAVVLCRFAPRDAPDGGYSFSHNRPMRFVTGNSAALLEATELAAIFRNSEE